MKELLIIYFLLFLFFKQNRVLAFASVSKLNLKAKGPKERSIHNSRLTMVPIINPIDIHSPYFPGMAQDMLEEVEKLGDKDTNIPMAPTPIGDGYDPQEIFTDVGKVLPQKIIQMMRANLGRKWYVKHMIRDLIFKGVAAATPINVNINKLSELLPGDKNAESIDSDKTAYKDSHKIDYKLLKVPSEGPPKSLLGGLKLPAIPTGLPVPK